MKPKKHPEWTQSQRTFYVWLMRNMRFTDFFSVTDAEEVLTAVMHELDGHDTKGVNEP